MIRLLSVVIMIFLRFSTARAESLDLEKILRLAERNDHRISAEEMSEVAADEAVTVARAAYFPKVDFEAIDSTGFPGSTGLLGVGGIMGSPYRKGIGAGLVAQVNVWDFGRTSHAVRAAKNDRNVAAAEAKLSRIDIDLETTRLYFDCARLRSQNEIWKFMREEAGVVADEVGRYVKTGQRSVVERYLANSQVEEAATGAEDTSQRIRLVLARLGTVTGTDLSGTDCPKIDAIGGLEARFRRDALTHPLVSKAEAETLAANERAGLARAGHLPRIVALGSYGYLESARLVPKNDYSVGVGLVIPLFDGLRTTAESRKASALATESSFRIQADQEGIEKRNEQYDETIAASSARLGHLEREIKTAQEGFRLAKKRYFSFSGTLVDVREALRNLVRTETQYDESRIDFVEGKVSKAVFNGARTPQS